MIVDMKDMSNKLYWTKGYEAGVELERERIIKMFQAKEANRTIMEVLEYPYTAKELEEMIMEGEE
jgi:hypothetical protein